MVQKSRAIYSLPLLFFFTLRASAHVIRDTVIVTADYTDDSGRPVTNKGCYADNTSNRALTYTATPITDGINPDKLTPRMCAFACASAGFPLSGTEYSFECYCGSTILASLYLSSDLTTGCSMPCTGASTSACGGSSKLSVLSTNFTASMTIPSPSAAAVIGNYVDSLSRSVLDQGCWTDSLSSRLLTGVPAITAGFGPGSNTPKGCALACAENGFSISGTEYGNECFCGNSLPAVSFRLSPSAGSDSAGCNMLCSGSKSYYCGSGNKLNILSTTLTANTAIILQSTSAGAKYTGCYPQIAGPVITLTATSLTSLYTGKAVVAFCTSYCASFGYVTAALGQLSTGNACYCYASAPITQPLADSNCQGIACVVGVQESCGSAYNPGIAGNLVTYSTGTTLASPIATYTTAGGAIHNVLGCYADTQTSRALPVQITTIPAGSMTPAACMEACSLTGYSVSGLEWAQECYCGSIAPATTNLRASPASTACTMPCKGNSLQACGNGNQILIYTTSSTLTTSKPGTVSGYTDGNSQAVTYLGCYIDSLSRTLSLQITTISGALLTPQVCAAACSAAGQSLSGTENGNECWCGSPTAAAISSLLALDTDCKYLCPGNNKLYCGAGWRLSVYKTTLSASSATSKILAAHNDALGQLIQYVGCYVDNINSRTFPTQIMTIPNSQMSPDTCQAACNRRGLPYGGLEYGVECYCSANAPAVGQLTDGSCNMPCSGMATVSCGAGNRLSVYWTTFAANSAQLQGVVPSYTASSNVVSYLGCYQDNVANRSLPFKINSVAAASLTPQTCAAACFVAGYKFSGTEYASECFCSLSAPTNSLLQTDYSCIMPCSGNSLINCGAGNRVSVYRMRAVTSSIIVPLYIYPLAGAWDWLFTAITSNPSVTFRVIVNPNNGPGDSSPPNTDYVPALIRLRSYSNVKLLGYVYVNYANRPYANVTADILVYSQWPSQYSVGGIFFDETPSAVNTLGLNQLVYMSNSISYARSILSDGQSSYMMVNPGTIPDSAYYNIADSLCSFENSYANYNPATSATYASTVTSQQTCVIMYSGPSTAAAQNSLVDSLIKTKLIGHIFISDQNGYTVASNLFSNLASQFALDVTS